MKTLKASLVVNATTLSVIVETTKIFQMFKWLETSTLVNGCPTRYRCYSSKCSLITMERSELTTMVMGGLTKTHGVMQTTTASSMMMAIACRLQQNTKIPTAMEIRVARVISESMKTSQNSNLLTWSTLEKSISYRCSMSMETVTTVKNTVAKMHGKHAQQVAGERTFVITP